MSTATIYMQGCGKNDIIDNCRVGGAIMRHLTLKPYNAGKKHNFSL